MICENCQQEHTGTYGSGRFCSNKCARGFSTKAKRQDINDKVSYTLKSKGIKPNPMFGFQKGYDSRREHIYTIGFYKRMSTLKIAKRNRRIETLPFDELKPSEKRIKVFHEQNGCCAICKLDKWLGKAITLAFHHKDGNKQNEARHNVEYLCPNCHSQTDHYGTKNLTKKQRERLSLGVRNAYKNGKYASVAHR